MATAVGFVAAATAMGAYLDARFGIRNDLRQLRHARAWTKRMDRRVADLGNTCVLYTMLSKVDASTEAMWFEGRTWTYRQLKDDVDRLASILRGHGIGTDDVVAMYTTNSPEMIISALACSKIGAVAGMINTNLRDDAFRHCVNVSQAKLILSTPDLSANVTCALPHLIFGIHSYDDTVPYTPYPIVAHINASSTTWVSSVPDTQPCPARNIGSVTILMFTSGTTGKPKACAVPNFLILAVSNPLISDMLQPRKYFPLRTYSSLPLFHGTGFFTQVCYSLSVGGTMCLSRKFSASHFWQDVHVSRATRVLYVGELCRYLLASPPSQYDRDHQCVVACGNGLRRDIWGQFKDRFNVPEIREFYRSTEGVSKFDNHNNDGSAGAGCVGFQGSILRRLEDSTIIVRFDLRTEQPWRHPQTGFCVRARQGEAGECIGRVRNEGILTRYYGNDEATNEKLMRNVFVMGDVWQRMGDLLVHDRDGWIRFADRIGDTFRWKGENVSAGEVRDGICEDDLVADAMVYGVKLNKYDGQAGAAGITLNMRDDASEDKLISGLLDRLKRRGLPNYAAPRLVRITEAIAAGPTFKQVKGELQAKGWSPQQSWGGDSLYWLNGTKYERLDESSWDQIEQGSAKL